MNRDPIKTREDERFIATRHKLVGRLLNSDATIGCGSVKSMKQRRTSRWLGVGLIFLLLAMLEIVDAMGLVNSALIPPRTKIAVRVAQIILSGDFIQPMAQTLFRLFLAYAIACPLGIAIGLLMVRVRSIHDLLEPSVEMLRPLPKVALLPPLMLFLGLGTSFKVTMIALGVIFPVIINTMQGARGVDRTLADYAHVRLPRRRYPLVGHFAGSGTDDPGRNAVGLAFALILAVPAEIARRYGRLGISDRRNATKLSVVDMYAWLVLLALLGYSLNAIFVGLERRFVDW